MNCTKALMVMAVCVAAGLAAAACGPKIQMLSWPPSANPSMDGLYPYDFSEQGLAGVEKLHERVMTTQVQDPQLEQQLLYALGRAQVDAFLWAMTMEDQVREDLMAELGKMLGVKKATTDILLADPGPLLEPFRMIDARYPKSPMAGASKDVRLAFRLLTHESLPDEQLARVAEVSQGRGPASAVVRGAVLVMVHDALLKMYVMDGGKRSRELVKRMERFAGPAPEEGEDETARIKRVLSWTAAAVETGSSDPDPLFIELRDMVEVCRWVLTSVHFPSGLPSEVELPDLQGLPGMAEDPFRYVVIGSDGKIRVATGVVFGVDEAGKVITIGKDSIWAWPGKEVEDAQAIPDALREASMAVAELGPIGGSPVWDRGAALAVHPNMTVDAVTPVLDILRASLDHVVVVGQGKGTTSFMATDVRPNCAMAGTRLGALLEEGEVVLQNVTVGDEDEASISDAASEDPLLLAGRTHDQTLSILGKPRPDVFLEVSWQEGEWTWGQLVAVYEGLLSGLLAQAEEYGVQAQVQIFLLPSMPMSDSRALEMLAEDGEELPELPDVQYASREEMVLTGAYGDFEEPLLDAWLSAYLSQMDLEQAATVVLDVARCWGGDYRERAVEALGEGKRSILEHVATYLGDPVMDEVAQNILEEAGARAVPVLVWKLMSGEEAVWMGAWNVLAEQDPEHIEDVLAMLLEDADPEIRLRALQLYGNSMPAGDYPELIVLLDDPDLVVRRWAMATCAMLGVQGAVDRLMQYVQSKKTIPAIRAEALYALGLLEAHEALPYMVEAAGHEDVEVRELAALALGSVGVGEEAMPALLGLLGDEEPTVVLNALRSLVNVGSMDAIPYVEAMLDDPSPGIASEAQITIDAIEEQNVVLIEEMSGEQVLESCDTFLPEDLSLLAQNPVEEALECLIDLSNEKDPDLREAACVALGEREDPDAIPALKTRTKDKYKAVRKAAWAALAILKKIDKKK